MEMDHTYRSPEDTPDLLAVYDQEADCFAYHQDLRAFVGEGLAEQPLWAYLAENGLLPEADASRLACACRTLNEAHSVFSKRCVLAGKGAYLFSLAYVSGKVAVTLTALETLESAEAGVPCDALTGLQGRNTFCKEMERIIARDPQGRYAVFFFDVVRFKAINDLFGFSEGYKLLVYIADALKDPGRSILTACRESADRFSFLADVSQENPDSIIDGLCRTVESYQLPVDVHCNVGVYWVTEPQERGNSMLDKAMMAQAAIKGSYARRINYYTNELRDRMLTEQEIAGSMNTALAERQFVIYYQPQYDHSTGMLVGAEALVRWLHPEKGLVSPALFIPIFENNGFIYRLDLYVFEQACRFLCSAMERRLAMVPVSINFSKSDIYSPDLVERLESIRAKYQVPAKYLRIELTESVLVGDPRAVNEVLKQLRACGYLIEMDDFGSGYSSLNVLKELEFDIIKLDMLFLAGDKENNRGGIILTSVVNMAKWLKLSIIAEGVETVAQADFLRSIGCNYVQGYLYAKPLPEKEYEQLISASQIGAILPQMSVIDTMNFSNFWDATSQETLIFNNFVGGAAIFRYRQATKEVEILRVNKKYVQELGMNLSEREIIREHGELVSLGDDTQLFFDTLDKAIQTQEEQECETWRHIKSPCCGEETLCVRSNLRVIGTSGSQYLIYSTIRNVAAEQQHVQAFAESEKRFKMAIEQANVYFWEYTIATKEMRPCFRCMRDLGLPPLMRDYPESAFERGVFPPEVHEMYRDWHVQVANGVKELEAVIPLTMDRIPFRVRYTTEFDENGHPVKAYGSAALVAD